MAHGIYNDEAMAYVGELPWHGLGKKLPENATWEQVQEAVGFYTVSKRSIFLAGPDGTLGNIVPDRMAVTRDDTNQPLSIVSPEYGVLQFKDCFEGVMEAGRAFGARFSTAGLLGPKGDRGWILAELPYRIEVAGDPSDILPFLLITTAHSGKDKLVLKDVTTRVVCQNTLGVAIGEKGGFQAEVRHTSNASQRLQDATQGFALMIENIKAFEAEANRLAAQAFSDAQFLASVDALLPMPTDRNPSSQLTNKRDAVQTLWDRGAGMKGLRGTAWGALQAWTEWGDHGQSFRGEGKEAAKLESAWLGKGAQIGNDAYNVIKGLVAA